MAPSKHIVVKLLSLIVFACSLATTVHAESFATRRAQVIIDVGNRQARFVAHRELTDQAGGIRFKSGSQGRLVVERSAHWWKLRKFFLVDNPIRHLDRFKIFRESKRYFASEFLPKEISKE